MAQDFLHPGGIVALPRETVQRLLRAQNGDAALYYLALLAQESTALSWERERLESAHTTLVSLALLDANTPPESSAPEKVEAEAPPEYGPADVAHALREQRDFPALVSELERLLGKRLAPVELQSLLLMQDYLALPVEVILLLVNYCVTQAQLGGAGRRPSMAQIKKEAFRWQRLGLDNLERAEQHLQKRLRQGEGAQRLLALLDIHDRAPVEAERRYLEAWIEMGFEDDSVRMAYEKTVLKKQGMNWPYMNSILRSWHQKGVHKKADILEKDTSRFRKTSAPGTQTTAAPLVPPSPARVQKDFDRQERLLEQLRKKED